MDKYIKNSEEIKNLRRAKAIIKIGIGFIQMRYNGLMGENMFIDTKERFCNFNAGQFLSGIFIPSDVVGEGKASCYRYLNSQISYLINPQAI